MIRHNKSVPCQEGRHNDCLKVYVGILTREEYGVRSTSEEEETFICQDSCHGNIPVEVANE